MLHGHHNGLLRCPLVKWEGDFLQFSWLCGWTQRLALCINVIHVNCTATLPTLFHEGFPKKRTHHERVHKHVVTPEPGELFAGVICRCAFALCQLQAGCDRRKDAENGYVEGLHPRQQNRKSLSMIEAPPPLSAQYNTEPSTALDLDSCIQIDGAFVLKGRKQPRQGKNKYGCFPPAICRECFLQRTTEWQWRV